MKQLLALLFVSIFILLLSCSDDQSTEPANSAPIIQSITANPSSIKVNETTFLSCGATDGDSDNLIYTWSCNEGSFPDGISDSTTTWEAPNDIGEYKISVTVSDGKARDQAEKSVFVLEASPILATSTQNLEFGNTNTKLEFMILNSGGSSATYKISDDKEWITILPSKGVVTTENDKIIVTVYRTSLAIGNYSGKITIDSDGGSVEINVSLTVTKWYGTSCQGTPTVTYEGKIYNTVQIGDQCWLNRNLNVGTMITSSSIGDHQRDNDIVEKYCYDNVESNCDIYGGLYQWNEVVQYTNNAIGTQGICPDGWHIPTLAEYETLNDSVGGNGNTLKDVRQGDGSGKGTNTSGFSALLGGYRLYTSGNFANINSQSLFWSSTREEDQFNYMNINSGNSDVYFSRKEGIFGHSVRCLKN